MTFRAVASEEGSLDMDSEFKYIDWWLLGSNLLGVLTISITSFVIIASNLLFIRLEWMDQTQSLGIEDCPPSLA